MAREAMVFEDKVNDLSHRTGLRYNQQITKLSNTQLKKLYSYRTVFDVKTTARLCDAPYNGLLRCIGSEHRLGWLNMKTEDSDSIFVFHKILTQKYLRTHTIKLTYVLIYTI